ncbi:MAG TPA: glycosyltransferase [Casimicrobiaceae bacterium]|nr:glycosyltransferase [Casimicrobiaceae bacterium]
MKKRSVLFHVQHLLGVGHLMRARLVAGGLARAGFDVCLVSGGMPIRRAAPEGIRSVQLPPIRVSDATFIPLRDDAGAPIDDAFRARRCASLLALYDELKPDVVIVETFPFGRRALSFELQPLLERVLATRPRPLAIVSVRDILQGRSAAREREALETARRHFDAILVHGDARLVRFDESFSSDAPMDLAPAVHHTGYVVAATMQSETAQDRREIVVSAGGGAVGIDLLSAAIAARHLSQHRDLAWRILVGDNLAVDQFRLLQRRAGPNAIVERAREDFPALLRNALVSVSQCGYNTMLDVMQSGAHAVFVPFAGGGETEQPMRAGRLAARGLAVVVDEHGLGAPSLAEAIDLAATRPPTPWNYDIDGVPRSAQIVAELCATRSEAAH